MKQYRRLIEPAAILLLVISAILPGWLSIAAGASALILLIALAASHFTGKKRLAVVVGLVVVLAVVFYINGQRNAKAQTGGAFEGMVEVANRSDQDFEAVKFTSTGELGTGPELVQKLETGQTIRFPVDGKGETTVRLGASTADETFSFETTIDGSSPNLVLELVEEGDGTHQFREK